MTLQHKDKGKYYTNIISKSPTPVVIQTEQFRVKGNVHVRSGYRLKDEINEPEPFVAVTDAIVYDLNGFVLYKTGFLAISRDQIIWIIPEKEILLGDPKGVVGSDNP